MNRSIAELKIDLLSQGMKTDIEAKGRKGGAGPAGGRFFHLKDGSCVNVPLWSLFTEKSPYILQEGKVFFNNVQVENIQLIPIPKFYSKFTSDHIPMKKVALLHGTDCIASTVVQKCIYWQKNLPCQFCGIELSLKSGDTIVKKTPNQLREVVGAAIEENVCQHMTLTIGSLARPDKGAAIYADIVREIKQYYEIPIHVQLEPPKSTKYLEDLYKIGVDTMGIHIESFDQNVLRTVCPGKIQIALNKYTDAWKSAVELFGECQVESYILVGIGESDQSVLKGAEFLSSLGVIPYIVPFRPISGSILENNPSPSFSRLLNLFTQIAQLLRDSGMDPLKNSAGCVRCGACSPLTEAYKYL
ncbi:MAG TPA: MSMEG_0568 family radical SAM protein [Candidatus Deferrimicrobium sp.]|nr:MSMEG_0568 family radical SAM protein [Candidatus Deferrimicrobium sp.]